jgi:CheY-like chemotaxis protein
LPEVFCDATRIRQVILNLVSNATRFTERGGIQVAAHVRDSHVVVSVRDTGPGIALEDVQRIFQPFQQAGVHLPGHEGGHGLGLAISKQFVDLHQGKMWLESQPGEGSNFCFELPITPLTSPAAPPERWIKENWVTRTTGAVTSSARLAERMILCDEAGELLPLLRRYAEHTEFVGAATLAAAIQDLEETPAQAVLINAPDLNTLLRDVEHLRSVVPDIPVIGCSLPRKGTYALQAGALGYLLKPVHQADLKRILASAGNPPQRILIVDDEEDTLWFLEQLVYVCCEGTEVLTAKSGEEALERMADWRPDLVLLDIIMPDMDGWQVLERKAMDPDLAGIPVAIISAQDPYETPSTQEADGTEKVTSPVIMAAMGGGLSIGRLLQCAEAISSMLLQPD